MHFSCAAWGSGLRQNQHMPSNNTDAATRIRTAVARVQALRQSGETSPSLGAAVLHIKQIQSRRFASTYADLLASAQYQSAARFFLDELYSTRDYAQRDAQFARIAGTLQTVFPRQVVQTAVALAELHADTETLDHQMAQAWLAQDGTGDDAERYLQAWRSTGQRDARSAQLAGVLFIGRELERLTRLPGLRLMLKMMRRPAQAAGLDALQQFLEAGFDTFAALARHPQGVAQFLERIESREAALMRDLFDAPAVTCGTQLRQLLGQAR